MSRATCADHHCLRGGPFPSFTHTHTHYVSHKRSIPNANDRCSVIDVSVCLSQEGMFEKRGGGEVKG